MSFPNWQRQQKQTINYNQNAKKKQNTSLRLQDRQWQLNQQSTKAGKERKRKNVTQFPKPDRLSNDPDYDRKQKKRQTIKSKRTWGEGLIKEGTNEIPVTKKNWKHEKIASHPHKTQTLLLRTGNNEREVLKPAWSWFGGDPYENCFFLGFFFRCRRKKPQKAQNSKLIPLKII